MCFERLARPSWMAAATSKTPPVLTVVWPERKLILKFSAVVRTVKESARPIRPVPLTRQVVPHHPPTSQLFSQLDSRAVANKKVRSLFGMSAWVGPLKTS